MPRLTEVVGKITRNKTVVLSTPPAPHQLCGGHIFAEPSNCGCSICASPPHLLFQGEQDWQLQERPCLNSLQQVKSRTGDF